MKKFVIFLQVHWVKILIITIGALALGGTGYYIFTSSSNYASLEPYTRRQLSGQMAAMMPMFLIVQVIAILMMLGVQMYMMSGGTMSSFSKKKLNEAKMDVKWADVIGMETAKKEAWEIVSLLKDRSKVKAIGGNIVKGTMFLGPPGCGKTYLAKAMATECGLPMITAVGSEFVAMFMGQGAARIKALFKQARNMAKIEGGCIIFIDEIDAFAQPRQMERGGGATTSANATINQFLTELDGVRHKENNIVVFAATNCDEDALDPALMRSGRFDRKIHIEKPNATERVKLIEFYLSRVDADPQIDINHFAEKAQWFSPSDINNMVRESAIIALRNNNPQIKTKDLEAGLRRVLTSVEQMGEDKILSDKTNVRWDDLIGMKETKRDAWEIVELLKDRQKLKVIGGQIVKGIMMIGAPGCGKTYLAKAMATESGFPFISVTGSDFVNKIYAGTGIKKLKNVFEEARKVAKAENGCIIFIDEIDAFIRPRNPDPFSHAQNQSSDHQVINQFLAEMDGLKGDSNNIIVIAATNIPEENLDEAVMRSGRFDRKIYFHKPNAKDRASLLEFYLKKVKFEKTIDIPTLAEKARCFSPADINNMVREAGIFTLREKRDTLNMDDLEKAMKRVMTSLERRGENKILGEHVNVKWDDIIGMDDAKEETWEIVKMLKDHKLVKASGGKIVKGVVLFGPPGCGKTYLAKAMATESGYPFMNIVGSEVVGMYVGQGAHKIREIFREARELARAEGGCIVFFDEFDSFTRPRVSPSGMGGGISHNAAINQFLTELDGLRQAENNIIVLGATNVTEHDIDPAILRSGRLERKVYVKHPTLEDRKKLFSFYLKNITHDESLDPNRLARMCVGFTPAKIENIIREASLIAYREKCTKTSYQHIHEAYNRIVIGALSREKHNPESLKKTACHESGHAIITYLIHPTAEVFIATIRARGGALGFIDSRDIEELKVNSPSKEHWLAEIQVLLAGYVAERITMGTTASGVGGSPGSDFHRAMHIARYMVESLGMGESGLIGDFTALTSQGLSEKTMEIIEDDTQSILQSCLKVTTETLEKHKDLLKHFTKKLLEKQELFHEDIQDIFDEFNLKAAAQITMEKNNLEDA